MAAINEETVIPEKRDEKKFLDALSEMYDKMLLMGYKDYQEVCDNFISIVEKNEKVKNNLWTAIKDNEENSK